MDPVPFPVVKAETEEEETEVIPAAEDQAI